MPSSWHSILHSVGDILYGINNSVRQMLDATAGGAFTAKSYNLGYDILEKISNNNGQWVDTRSPTMRTAGVRDADAYATLAK